LSELDEKARRHLPLTAAVYHILLALADEDRHGLGIMEDLEARIGRKVLPGPGTLYGTIKRMLDSGLIVEVDRPDSAAEDSRRRYYSLTPMGLRVVALETERLTTLLRIAEDKRVRRGVT
jgi:DNA-binding PadR family transcriptional regulator